MIIQKSRIRSLNANLPGVTEGERVALGVDVSPDHPTHLPDLGFSEPLKAGETVLPPASGPVSRRNAEGDEIVHRDQPQETAFRQVEWRWEEFRGRYGREERSRIVDVPYKRYPRTFVPPASLELRLVDHRDRGWLVVIDATFEVDRSEPGPLVHAINLLLELFGECEVFTEQLESLQATQVRRVNWDILPRGRHPWADVEARVRDVLGEKGDRERVAYEHRWERINTYGPEFVAVGRAGFRGYLVFGFPESDLYVLESAYYGNATYVLGEDWEQLSQRTKAELLDADLHRGRIIHREGWDREIHELLDDGEFSSV